MRKNIFLFLFLIISCPFAGAQSFTVNINYTTNPGLPGNEYIYYTAGEKLSISDFKGAPDNSNAIAITSSGFAFKSGFRGNSSKAVLNIEVYCTFSKPKSWMKERGKNKYILSHEQLHFDISYLSTVRFIQKLKQADFTINNCNKLLEKIYRESITELEEKQQEYDTETMNGRLEDKQSAWIEKINREIGRVDAR